MDVYRDIFDFDGDGKLSPDEELMGYLVMDDVLSDERRKSRSRLEEDDEDDEDEDD